MTTLRDYLKHYGKAEKILGSKILPFFAKMAAPYDVFDSASHAKWLSALSQADGSHRCVYCGSNATDCDHVRPIITEGAPTGFGHTYGNLVPCCRSCNSRKWRKSWREFVRESGFNNATAQLEALEHAFPTSAEASPVEWAELVSIHQAILELLRKADLIAERVHQRRGGRSETPS